MTGECRLCGKHGIMERHHVFGGVYRKTSDRIEGCVVTLCPECHRHIHSSKGWEDKQQLQCDIQYEVMDANEWTVRDWLKLWGKSWI